MLHKHLSSLNSPNLVQELPFLVIPELGVILHHGIRDILQFRWLSGLVLSGCSGPNPATYYIDEQQYFLLHKYCPLNFICLKNGKL